MKFDAVIFDYSGVLVQMDHQIARSFFRERSPLPVAELTRRWEEWCSDHADDSRSAERMWRDFWASLGRELELPGPTLEEISSFDYLGMFKACPDAVAALGEARRLGLHIGVLSNSALPRLESPSAPLGLASLVDFIRVPYRGNAVKPSRQAYLEMAQCLGAAVERCLFFDNEPEYVAAARLAGMSAYLVDRKQQETSLPAGIVKDLSLLGALVSGDSGAA